ncbi:AraC family transcriptional regulator [Shimia litoralis]|uniref:AraC family transcriptional regulator n=1 Tax=Shimia litoralis TaxID=420403 RepID=A0A4U7N186_9RHOB|nr:AraC family transcriptional regulator [Shimia litoralis]TKZ19390.1 AraC family transcriptional regulator [Shimia litoralis]
MTDLSPTTLATVSRQFIDDWLDALRGCCTPAQMESFTQRAGLRSTSKQIDERVTLDQIVHLYQVAAVESHDEMMGLWSRPIRPRALQHLLTTVQAAETLPSALYRFSTFWNLLLDDYLCEVHAQADHLSLSLIPQGAPKVQRFGHMLILKLAHGLLSWLSGYELRVSSVALAFPRPDFVADYGVIFPARVSFESPASTITFIPEAFGLPARKGKAELAEFLSRAPRDWIFTSSHKHTWSLRIREFLYQSEWHDCHLVDAANAFHKTPRTLMRHLDGEGTSFQAIKDELRRDIAIRDIHNNQKSIEKISQDLGFSSASNFHRAFRRWTGDTPGKFRRSAAVSASL